MGGLSRAMTPTSGAALARPPATGPEWGVVAQLEPSPIFNNVRMRYPWGSGAEPTLRRPVMPLAFEEEVTTRVELRTHVKEPTRKVSHKAIDHIDGICARFIAA